MREKIVVTKRSLLAVFVFMLAAFFLLQGKAFALSCEGTIYFQAPSSWTTAYLMGGGQFVAGTIGTSGWYEFDAATSAQGSSFQFNSTGTYYPAQWVNSTTYNLNGNQVQGDSLSCSDFNGTTSLYVYENPTTAGLTVISNNPPDAKYFYFMSPDDQLWMSSVPMLSTDGGKTGVAMKVDPLRCGWFYYVWFNQTPPSSVVVYRDNDALKEELIGWDGYDEAGSTVNSIPLGDLFSVAATESSNSIFFIPDASQWPETALEADKGIFTTDPGVTGNCSYSLAAIIYDTDASLHPAFSCYSSGGEGCQVGAQEIDQTRAVAAVNACIGVTPNVLQDTLSAVKKPLLRTAAMGGNGEKCFITEALFNELFNATKDVNEMSCFDMPFSRATDGQWEFNSDFYTSPGISVQGGFYPAEATTDASIMRGSTPVAAARTKRLAEGPVFVGPLLRALDDTENAQKFDLMCNGPGWTGGHDCSGAFGGGDSDPLTTIAGQVTGVTTNLCIWGWSCQDDKPTGWLSYIDKTETVSAAGVPRWTSDPSKAGQAGRNQQFCFESHAQFKYKEGLRFNFRGDDDIWVFIGGKLAVDLGGTHLAAPGYVDLSKIKDKHDSALVEGQTYDLDIFFCDRRTTMSNVRIKTNMYIQQNTGISYTKNPNYTGEGTGYEICWETTGDGDCASAMSGVSATTTQKFCGDSIQYSGTSIFYNLYKGTTLVYDSTKFAPGNTYFGGINLSNYYQPVINRDALSGLPSGTYRLWISASGKRTSITFRIAGNLDILTANGEDSTGHVYKVRTSAMAGVRIPVYISALGDSLSDNNIDMDLASAVGENYTLLFSDGLLVYADSTGDTPVTSSTIGANGVDTVWATVPLEALTSANTITDTIYISGRTKKLALTYYLPQISFVDPTYSNQVTSYGNAFFSEDTILYKGSYYEAYLIAFDPTTSGVCADCNFSLSVYPASDGITAIPVDFVNGKGSLQFRSTKLYPDAANAVTDSAYFTVLGAENPQISAKWSGLTFIDPPVPTPDSAKIFDTKGKSIAYNGLDQSYTASEYLDGIADSLAVYYHRPFAKDSLPDSILVTWDSNKNAAPILLNKAQIEAAATCGDSLCDSVLTFSGVEFSKKVQTTGSGLVDSWARYTKNGKETSGHFSCSITDKVSPIILKARIAELSTDGMFQVKVSFSEAVTLGTEVQDQKTKMFNYYLRSATESTNKYQVVTATSAAISTSTTISDSTATMIYVAATGVDIPSSGDFVRARPLVISDINGNYLTDYNVGVPSPWMMLEGDAPSTIASIKMTTFDAGSNKNRLNQDPITYHFVDIYDSLSQVAKDNPNTLGYLIKTDMGNILADSSLSALIASKQLNLADIQLVYEQNIFTNLGSFVASKKSYVACNDSIFGGDCTEKRGYVYLAWNLVADNGRFVGTGAYISKLYTYMRIPKVSKTQAIAGKQAKHNVTQVWGVRRGSGTVE
ncbi:MAG: fibro-slime domain-containing protein [Fibrobacteraceae bacterium]